MRIAICTNMQINLPINSRVNFLQHARYNANVKIPVVKIRWFSIIQRGTFETPQRIRGTVWWFVVLAQIIRERIQALRIRVKDLVDLRLCMKVTSRQNRAAKRTRQNCTSCVHDKHASRQTPAKLTTRCVKISMTWAASLRVHPLCSSRGPFQIIGVIRWSARRRKYKIAICDEELRRIT